ncbi:unnamed protein product, partial [Adineta steineri]
MDIQNIHGHTEDDHDDYNDDDKQE